MPPLSLFLICLFRPKSNSSGLLVPEEAQVRLFSLSNLFRPKSNSPGLVVPEEAQFGRGQIYHPILYEWGGGRPAFGGRGAACSSDGSMVSPLPCGGFDALISPFGSCSDYLGDETDGIGSLGHRSIEASKYCGKEKWKPTWIGR
jgi:hypothetical protein